jgi:hypothetical protein
MPESFNFRIAASAKPQAACIRKASRVSCRMGVSPVLRVLPQTGGIPPMFAFDFFLSAGCNRAYCRGWGLSSERSSRRMRTGVGASKPSLALSPRTLTQVMLMGGNVRSDSNSASVMLEKSMKIACPGWRVNTSILTPFKTLQRSNAEFLSAEPFNYSQCAQWMESLRQSTENGWTLRDSFIAPIILAQHHLSTYWLLTHKENALCLH